MNTPKTASTIRYEQEVKAETYGRLSAHPDMQAEAIARHYVAHATTALNLLRMVEMRRNHPGQELDQAIDLVMEQIKTNHLYSFGIELAWPQKPL